MSSRLLAVTVDAHDPARLAGFWADVLGRVVIDDLHGAMLPGSDTQVGLRFAPSRAERVGPNRVHLHLTSTSPTDQQHTIAAALELGACHLDVGQLPDEGHVVLADPEGNAYCVIEAGNSFLTGCGLLGELACDGSREVGLFWAEALNWPLVGPGPGDRGPVPARWHEGRVGRSACRPEAREESAAVRPRCGRRRLGSRALPARRAGGDPAQQRRGWRC